MFNEFSNRISTSPHPPLHAIVVAIVFLHPPVEIFMEQDNLGPHIAANVPSLLLSVAGQCSHRVKSLSGPRFGYNVFPTAITDRARYNSQIILPLLINIISNLMLQ